MAAAPKAKTPGREDPEARMPDRSMDDPNIIRNRSGQPVTLRYTGDEDHFHFDRSIIPQGWDYQWKVKTIKNWEWVQHQVQLAANGWEPVPADRHDGLFMPKGFKGPIERGGQILMERDIRLTVMSKQRERNAAQAPVRASRNMAGMMGPSDMVDFSNPSAAGATGVRVNRIPMGAPPSEAQAGYNYTVEE